MIANSPEFRVRVAQALSARLFEGPAAPAPLAKKMIFGGFYSHADKALLAEFQRADWQKRQDIVAAQGDARLRQLGRRLVAFHAPQLLSTEDRAQFEDWLFERWSAPDAPETEWMAVTGARRAVDEFRGNNGLDQALIGEIGIFPQGFDIKAS